MKKLLGILFLLVSIILTACQPDQTTPPAVESPPAADEQTLYIAPFWQPCVGVAPMLCMQVKESQGADWTYFYDRIEGFTYEPGFSYELLVKKEDVKNPPADGSSLKWTLVEEVSKSPVEMPQMDLTGTEWNLVSNQENAPLMDTQITLSFEEEGQLGGSAGCNSYFGGYEHNGFAFSISSPLGSTLMACEEPIMNQETEYLNKLNQMEFIQVEGETLLLVSSDGLFLEYEKAQ
ncbi:MAG: hypothetical protein CL609_03500 [Anaerolineaceae bacterium]|nr:hypothetical protein [Anaerolineaceae bacterium]